MSDQDYRNGRNGYFWGTSNHEYNYDYQRGVSDSIAETACALTDIILHGTGRKPSVGSKIVFYFSISVVFFFIVLFVGFVGLNIFVHSLPASTQLSYRLQDREPFKFHGYTLSSGSLHDKFIDWHLVNPNGKTIWTQPVSMDHEWTHEERPSGYITNDTCIHPGRIVFATVFSGPKNEYAPYFLVLNHQGKVISFSDNPPRPKANALICA